MNSPKEDLLELIELVYGRTKISSQLDYYGEGAPNQKLTEDLISFLKKNPCPVAYPDDSFMKYPCMIAFYRPRPQKKKKNTKMYKRFVNNSSVYMAVITNLGDLGSIARTFKHFGYSKMVFCFDFNPIFSELLNSSRIPYFKFQTWAHMIGHVLPEERVFLQDLEEMYPSHYQGQLKLAI